MQQPELGRRLTALRKEKNLTQEELVEKSHVSVRTIQRIESGEVMPRMSTVKILLEALGERLETFTVQPTPVMEATKPLAPATNQNVLLLAVLAGALYLVMQLILGAMEISWFTSDREWGFRMNAIYATLTVVMVISYAFFARGFIELSNIFENKLLKGVTYMLIVATAGIGVLDVSSLAVDNVEDLWLHYAVAAVIFGALSIVFGIGLIRLQDGMGEMSRIAGMLEIVIGCLLATVFLFFITYIIFIPAMVLEILVLYRGYEYLSRPQG
jgi:transcriptional regulator with XRE-family HTH domain